MLCFLNWKCATYLITKFETHSYRKIVQPSFLNMCRPWTLAVSGVPGARKEKKDILENSGTLKSGDRLGDAD